VALNPDFTYWRSGDGEGQSDGWEGNRPSQHRQQQIGATAVGRGGKAESMKNNGKKKALTFGEFVAAVYAAWGKRRGTGIVRFAVNARLVQFRGRERFVISEG